MKDFSSLKQALKLADIGLETSPLSENSKVPLKGSHGYLEATKDSNTLFEVFEKQPKANLCLRLDTSHLIMVDVDLHTKEANGKETLLKLADKKMVLPHTTYIEQTPHNGLHYYFKADVPVGDIKDAFGKDSGIEIKTRFSSVYPSEIDGKQYTPNEGCTWKDLQPAPQWLIDYITGSKEQARPIKIGGTTSYRTKKYTGKLLDMIAGGCAKGKRNAYLTSLTGKMFAVGAEPETIYNLLLLINKNFTTPPLKDQEVNTIFQSILKTDMKKRGVQINDE